MILSNLGGIIRILHLIMSIHVFRRIDSSKRILNMSIWSVTWFLRSRMLRISRPGRPDVGPFSTLVCDPPNAVSESRWLRCQVDTTGGCPCYFGYVFGLHVNLYEIEFAFRTHFQCEIVLLNIQPQYRIAAVCSAEAFLQTSPRDGLLGPYFCVFVSLLLVFGNRRE